MINIDKFCISWLEDLMQLLRILYLELRSIWKLIIKVWRNIGRILFIVRFLGMGILDLWRIRRLLIILFRLSLGLWAWRVVRKPGHLRWDLQLLMFLLGSMLQMLCWLACYIVAKLQKVYIWKLLSYNVPWLH